MRKKYYKKLVRDGVIDAIIRNGESPEYEVLSGPKLGRGLMRKVLEEARELVKGKTHAEILAESADLVELIRAILKFHGLTLKQLEKVRKKKLKDKGGFKKGIFLKSVLE